jgi:hypothetical protein
LRTKVLNNDVKIAGWGFRVIAGYSIQMSGAVPYQPQPEWPPSYQASAARPDPRWPIELWYWSAEVVTFRQNRSALITNSPLAAGLFYGARAAGNVSARRHAKQLAEPQWRLAGTGQVILDARGLALDGSWGGHMRVEYSEVPSWRHDQDALQITVIDYYPLMLRTHAADDLVGWFGRLSEGKLWQELAVQTWQPAPQVPIIGWEQRDRRFTCAVPAGWEPLTDRAYLADAAKDAANNRQRLLFMLRRTGFHVAADFNQLADQEILRNLGTDPGAFERGALRLAGLKAQNSNGVVVSRPVVVLMDSERATMLDTSMTFPHIRVRLRELFVGRRGQWFMFGYTAADPVDPQALFDRFAAEFQTMIATWQWRF